LNDLIKLKQSERRENKHRGCAVRETQTD